MTSYNDDAALEMVRFCAENGCAVVSLKVHHCGFNGSLASRNRLTKDALCGTSL
jgi:hypothetical protein